MPIVPLSYCCDGCHIYSVEVGRLIFFVQEAFLVTFDVYSETIYLVKLQILSPNSLFSGQRNAFKITVMYCHVLSFFFFLLLVIPIVFFPVLV